MATSYTGATGAIIYGGKPLRNPAITDLTLVPERTDTDVPLTFGQPFKMGDWNPKTQDLELYSGATKLQAQADDIALHVDGSVRFAVVSATVPAITNGTQQTLSLRTGRRTARVNQSLALPGDWDLRAEATIYRHQITRITLTNRLTGGYVLGEKVKITLDGGQGKLESYEVTVKAGQTGNGFGEATSIANEFITLAAASANFEVYKPGGAGFETFRVRPRDRAGAAFTVTIAYTGTSVITNVNESEYLGAPQLAVAELRAPLLARIASINAGTATTGVRFHGPTATEIELVVPFSIGGVAHPHFVSRTMVRMYQGGAKVRADVVLENNFLLVPNPRTVTCSLQLKNGATTKHSEAVFDHYSGCRWHKAVWHSATSPEVFFRHNVPYFLDSKAVLNYDRNMGINEDAIANVYAQYQSVKTSQAQFGPLNWLLWRPGMGDTGGRDDIGPSPRWFVMHLLAQDKRTKEVMLAQSDAAGCWGVRFRDETTGLLAKITDYPLISVGGYVTTPAMPQRIDPAPTGADLEHQADMSYIPYLITGDYYYLEETQFWGGYCLLQRPSGYRADHKGLLWGQTVRAVAWSLRNVSNAARITPEAHPLKQYFVGVFDNNMEYGAETYNATKAAQGLISPMGAVLHPGSLETAPWQMDYLYSTLVLNADNGHVNAQKIVNWVTPFIVERMLSPDFCVQKAGGYYWLMKTPDGLNFVTTWGQLYELNYPSLIGVACELVPVGGYAGTPNSYAAYGLGMAGAAYNNGYARGADAIARFAPWANVYNAWKNDPTWAVVPRIAQP